jgi:MYND finger protein
MADEHRLLYWWEKEGQKDIASPTALHLSTNLYQQEFSNSELREKRKQLELAYPPLKQIKDHREKARVDIGRFQELELWKQLRTFGTLQKVDPSLYRLDCFGNVVSWDSRKLGLTTAPGYWVVDHRFPWSRGGLTRLENLQIVQWQANARKSDRLESCIQLESLRIGVQKEQFLFCLSCSNKVAGFVGYKDVRSLLHLSMYADSPTRSPESESDTTPMSFEEKQNARFSIFSSHLKSGSLQGLEQNSLKQGALTLLNDVLIGEFCFKGYRKALFRYIKDSGISVLSRKQAKQILDHYQTMDIVATRPSKIDFEDLEHQVTLELDRRRAKLSKDTCVICKAKADFECGACEKFGYCDSNCQMEHWTTLRHRETCGKI